jgi:hypothetical protein
MKTYFNVWAWGFALVQAALAGEAGPALEQRTQSFTIILNGSVSDVRRFLDPYARQNGRQIGRRVSFTRHMACSARASVFTTSPGHGRDRLWLLTTYDARNGRVEYVVVTPAFTANEIKIRVVPDGERHCKATITYRRSALAPDGNEEVAKLDAHWAEEQRIHWETAINEALAKGGIHD